MVSLWMERTAVPVVVGPQREAGSPRHCRVLGRCNRGLGGGGGCSGVSERDTTMAGKEEKAWFGNGGPAQRNAHASRQASEHCLRVISRALLSTPGARDKSGGPRGVSKAGT